MIVASYIFSTMKPTCCGKRIAKTFGRKRKTPANGRRSHGGKLCSRSSNKFSHTLTPQSRIALLHLQDQALAAAAARHVAYARPRKLAASMPQLLAPQYLPILRTRPPEEFPR